ncbi:MAG: tail fiber protein [Cetobacterium sp.]
MRTDGAIITNAGQELLSYALANNKQVNFTKVKLGKGDVNTFDEAKKLTDVVSFYKQIPITSIARNNAGIVRIRSSFTNADFPLQVVLKEIGVFAVVEGKSEVLFGYVNDGEGESFPPGSSGNIVERVRDIYVGVSTNTQVTAVVDRSVVYATIYDLDEEIAKCAKKITRVNPGNGIHGGGTLGEDITISIKSNDTSINLDATNGITLKKTSSVINDITQLFTAKGALDLKNLIIENYTTLMNNIRDTLTNMINLKLPHGGYSGTGLDLQNNKVDKSITITAGKGLTGGGNLSANRTINISNADGSLVIGDDDIKVNIYDGVDSTSTNQAASPASVKKAYDKAYSKVDSDSRYTRFLGTINTSTNLDALLQSGYHYGQLSKEQLGGFAIYSWGHFTVEKTYASCVQTFYSHTGGDVIRRVGYNATIGWGPWYRVYTSIKNPSKEDVGLSNVMNYGISSAIDSDSETQYANSKAVKTAYDRGSDGIDKANNANSNANGRVSKTGDTMTGNLTISTGNYPSLFLNNITSGYNKALRIEHSAANLLRFIKYTNIDSTAQDKVLDWDMSAGGTIYHTGKKPSANDVGAYTKAESDSRNFKSRGRLKAQDWNTILDIGIYGADEATGANMPSGVYAWGNLSVLRDGDTTTQVYYPHSNFYGDRYTPTYRVKHGATNWTGWKKLYGDNYNPAVTDIRLSGNIQVITWDKAINTFASGRVQTGSYKDSNGTNLDGVFYANLQKCVNGTWYTVATS